MEQPPPGADAHPEEVGDVAKGRDFMERINLFDVNDPSTYIVGVRRILAEFFPNGIETNALRVSNGILKDMYSVAHKKLTELMKQPNFEEFEEYSEMFTIPYKICTSFINHIITVKFSEQIVKVLKHYSYKVPLSFLIKLIEPLKLLLTVEEGIEQVLNDTHMDRHYFLTLIQFVSTYVTEDMGFEGETLSEEAFNDINTIFIFITELYTNNKYQHHFITQPMIALFIKKLGLNGLLEDLRVKTPDNLPTEQIYILCSNLLHILGPSTSIDRPGSDIITYVSNCAICNDENTKCLALARIMEFAYYLNLNDIYTQDIHKSVMNDINMFCNILAQDKEKIEDEENVEKAKASLKRYFELFANTKTSFYALRINLQEFNNQMYSAREKVVLQGELSVLYYKIITKLMLATKDAITCSYEKGHPMRRDDIRHDNYDASSIIDSEEDSEKYINGNELELYKCVKVVNVANDLGEQNDTSRLVERKLLGDSDYKLYENEESSTYDNVNINTYSPIYTNEGETQGTDESVDGKQLGGSLDHEVLPNMATPELSNSMVSPKRYLYIDKSNPNPSLIQEHMTLSTLPQQLGHRLSPLVYTPADQHGSGRNSSGSSASGSTYGISKLISRSPGSPTAETPSNLNSNSFNSNADGSTRAPRTIDGNLSEAPGSTTTVTPSTKDNVNNNRIGNNMMTSKLKKTYDSLHTGENPTVANDEADSSANSAENWVWRTLTRKSSYLSKHFSPDLLGKFVSPLSSNKKKNQNNVNTQTTVNFYLPIFKNVEKLIKLENLDEIMAEIAGIDKCDKTVQISEFLIVICELLSAYYYSFGYAFKLLGGACFCKAKGVKKPCSTCSLFEIFCSPMILTTGNIIRTIFGVAEKDDGLTTITDLVQKSVDIISTIYSMPSPLPCVFMNIVDKLVTLDGSNSRALTPILGSSELLYLSKSQFFMTELISSITIAVSNELAFNDKISNDNENTKNISKYISVYIKNTVDKEKDVQSGNNNNNNVDNNDDIDNDDIDMSGLFKPLKNKTLFRYLLDTNALTTLYDTKKSDCTLLSLPPAGIKLLNILLKIQQITSYLMGLRGIVARVAVGVDNRYISDSGSELTAEKMIGLISKSKKDPLGIIELENGTVTELGYFISQTNARLLCELACTSTNEAGFSCVPISQNSLIVSTMRIGIRNAVVYTKEIMEEQAKLMKMRKVKVNYVFSRSSGKDGLSTWMRIQLSKKINGQVKSSGEHSSDKQKIPRMIPSLCTLLLKRMSSIASIRSGDIKNILASDPKLGVTTITGLLSVMYISIRKEANQKYTKLQLYECKRMVKDVIGMLEQFLNGGTNDKSAYLLLKKELSMHNVVFNAKSVIVKPINQDNLDKTVADVFDLGRILGSELSGISVSKDFINSNEPGKEMINGVQGNGLTSWTIFEVMRYWYYVYTTSNGALICSKTLMMSLFKCIHMLISKGKQAHELLQNTVETKFFLNNFELFHKIFCIFADKITKTVDDQFKELKNLNEIKSFIRDDIGTVTLDFVSITNTLVSRPEFNKNIAKVWVTKGIMNTLRSLCHVIQSIDNLLANSESDNGGMKQILQETSELSSRNGGRSNKEYSNSADNIEEDESEKYDTNNKVRIGEEEEEKEEVKRKKKVDINISYSDTETSKESECRKDNSYSDLIDVDEEAMIKDEIQSIMASLSQAINKIKSFVPVIIRNITKLCNSVKYKDVTVEAPIRFLVNTPFDSFDNEQKIALLKLVSNLAKTDLKGTTVCITETIGMTVEDYYVHIAKIISSSNSIEIFHPALHLCVRLVKSLKSNEELVKATSSMLEAVKKTNITSKKIQSSLSFLQSKFKN